MQYPCEFGSSTQQVCRTTTRCIRRPFLILASLLCFLPSAGREPAHAEDAVVVATMPGARDAPALAWTGSRVYILGGTNGLTNLDTILEFDPATEVVAAAPGALPIGAYGFPAVWDGSHTYTFGGARMQVADCPGCQSIANISKYSPSGQPPSSSVAQMPSLRHASSAVWDGRYAFIFGGITGTAGGHLDEIVRFDPGTLSVSIIAPRLSHARSYSPAVLTPQGVYIFGGYRDCGGSFCDDIDRFDPATETLVPISTRLPQPLGYASAVWSGRFVYIFGGNNGISSFSDQILRFDPVDETFMVLPE